MYLLVPFRPVGIQCFHLTIVIAGLDAYFTSLSNGFNNIKQFSVTECSMIRTLVTTWAQQCSNSWLFFSDLQQVLFTVCVCVCVCTRTRACVHTKLLQSCPTLCNPMENSLPGSPVHGILQTRILEWVAMPSSKGSSGSRDRIHFLHLTHVDRQIL